MKVIKFTLIMAMAIFVLAACGGSKTEPSETDTGAATENSASDVTEQETEAEETESEETPDTVEITDAHGTVTVPVNPEKVVALDNRTYETLSDWDVKLAAAPLGLLTADSPYLKDDSIADIGMHIEPNLEAIAAVDPDLVIVGQRFGQHYEEIKKLVPNAVVIDLNIDVSKDAETPGDNLVNGLKDITHKLGQIFDKNEEAEKLTADFDEAIEKAKAAYDPEETVMGVIVSGGDIGFSAPGNGRVWGPLYEIFDWTPALDVKESSSDHQGDEVSVEAIAQSNPDWIFVMDRDAPIASVTDKVPAQDVIDNSPALKNTTAVTKNQILYAPEDMYLNESIQTFLELFEDLSDRLSK